MRLLPAPALLIPDQLDKTSGMDTPDNEDDIFEAMAEEAAGLIRYRFLPELVGTKLIVQSMESMAADVLAAFPHFIDRSKVNPDRFHAWPAYSRYGMTHFEIPAPAALLQQGTRSGMEVLAELGFVDPDDAPPFLDCLEGEDFLKSLRQNQPHFLLFLVDENPNKETLPHRPPGSPFKTVCRVRFPVSFKVTDACLANTDWLWRYKHFYW
jgi:hypothetical protein